MKFKLLWDAHPSNNDEENPCTNLSDGKPLFKNQCAIRMGVCLERAKFDMSDYQGVRCWHHPEFDNHTLRVEELVKYLKKKLPKSCLTVKHAGESMIDHFDFDGLTGIIAFIDFWGENGTGDHIDIWDGSEMTSGDLDYFERADTVYFWEIE